MPLFFFIDKDFLDDPTMRDIDDVVLSYTFFKYANRHQVLVVVDTDQNLPPEPEGMIRGI